MDSQSDASQRQMFEVLVREHHRRFLAYALSLIRDHGQAEDIVQEAFLAAYRNFARFDPKRDFGAWMRGIVRMKYLEHMRRRRDVPMGDEVIDLLDRETGQWDEVRRMGKDDAFDAIKHCMGKLPDLLRKVVDGFYFRQLSCREIGSEDGAQDVTIRQRLNRARNLLGECLRATLNTELVSEERI